ncbi:hypothetical protein C5167_044043 [Papaver somniferum]|uniref:Uncharacterized protein n=1 Tax=Papaver somniferum TaxID=3469 RepID=A0A4Y7L9W2_PAPSO|nr:hypothetical protein C5167_044043 [Papaver somniferum]
MEVIIDGVTNLTIIDSHRKNRIAVSNTKDPCSSMEILPSVESGINMFRTNPGIMFSIFARRDLEQWKFNQIRGCTAQHSMPKEYGRDSSSIHTAPLHL